MTYAMKKMLGVMLSLSLFFSMGVTAFAAEDEYSIGSIGASSVQQEKYSEYGKILSEITERYGIKASLEPIEWFIENGFPDESEFAEKVQNNCELLTTTPPTDSETTTTERSFKSLRATNVYKTPTWEDTRYKSNFDITVKFSFAIRVSQHPDTGKYFISEFNAARPELLGKGQGVLNGYSTKLIDGGRTRVTTSQLTLTKDGANYAKTSSAYIYCNTSKGKITVRGY